MAWQDPSRQLDQGWVSNEPKKAKGSGGGGGGNDITLAPSRLGGSFALGSVRLADNASPLVSLFSKVHGQFAASQLQHVVIAINIALRKHHDFACAYSRCLDACLWDGR